MTTARMRHLLSSGFAGLMALLVCLNDANAGVAHVHGAAQVVIAVDGKELQLELTSPLDSLVGFEHAPRTAQQQRAVADMMAAFRQPEQLFAPTAGAQCKAGPPVVSSPMTDGAGPAGDTGADAHGELQATIVFRCLVPTALRSVEFKLLDVFRRMKRVDVQLAGPKGQKAATITSSQRSLSW